MTQTITRLFDRREDAEAVVRELERFGLSHDDISLIAPDQSGRGEPKSFAARDGDDVADSAATGAGTGAALGGVIGGGAGLLAGLGALAIPGIGPAVAAGWLGSTLLGAAAGAATGGVAGGLIGALTEAGVSEEDAHVYAEGVRRGGTLVAVRAREEDRMRIEQVFDQYQGSDAGSRGPTYRESGWSRFDESGSGMNQDRMFQDRDRF